MSADVKTRRSCPVVEKPDIMAWGLQPNCTVLIVMSRRGACGENMLLEDLPWIGGHVYGTNVLGRTLLGALGCVAILACTGARDAGGDAKSPTGPASDSGRPGSDRDEHGCIGSAGYGWCERTKQCERAWELAKKKSFENSREAFEAWCNGGQ